MNIMQVIAIVLASFTFCLNVVVAGNLESVVAIGKPVERSSDNESRRPEYVRWHGNDSIITASRNGNAKYLNISNGGKELWSLPEQHSFTINMLIHNNKCFLFNLAGKGAIVNAIDGKEDCQFTLKCKNASIEYLSDVNCNGLSKIFAAYCERKDDKNKGAVSVYLLPNITNPIRFIEFEHTVKSLDINDSYLCCNIGKKCIYAYSIKDNIIPIKMHVSAQRNSKQSLSDVKMIGNYMACLFDSELPDVFPSLEIYSMDTSNLLRVVPLDLFTTGKITQASTDEILISGSRIFMNRECPYVIKYNILNNITSSYELCGSMDNVSSLSVSPNGKLIAVIHYDSTIHIYRFPEE